METFHLPTLENTRPSVLTLSLLYALTQSFLELSLVTPRKRMQRHGMSELSLPKSLPEGLRYHGTCSVCSKSGQITAADDLSRPLETGWCKSCTLKRAEEITTEWIRSASRSRLLNDSRDLLVPLAHQPHSVSYCSLVDSAYSRSATPLRI